MSEFNFDAFRPVRVTDIREKQSQVEAASEAKRALLSANKPETTWVDKTGLEAGSFLGNRVNDVASLVSGASRMVGDITSLPGNIFAALETTGATKADYDAYARVQQGSTKDEDIKRAKQFFTADYLRNQAKDARNTFDISSIVDQSNRNSLSDSLGQDFDANWNKVKSGWKDGKPTDVVSGIASLLMNAGEAVITNPSAAREYIIENAPQLLVGGMAGAAGKGVMAASNIGYAADNYRTGLEAYAAKNGGALPPEEERTKMALYAASLAAAEQAGDMFGLHVGKAAEGAAKAATKTGALQSLKNTLKAGIEGGAEETLTEGYQTFAEGEVNQKPASAKDIFEGAVVGGVAGAGLSGGMRAASEVTKSTPEHAQERAVEADKTAKINEAVKENNPDKFLDESSPNYDPATAVKVVTEATKKEDITPEQAKENVKKSGEIISKLESQKATLEEAVANRNPKALAALEADIKDAEERVKSTDPSNKELMELESGELEMLRKEYASLTDKEQVLKHDNLLTTVSRQLEEAREVHHGLVRMTNPAMSKEELTSTINDADSSDTKVASKAGNVLLNLSMAAQDALDPTVAKNLAENKSNGLSEEQRTQLREFSEARLAESALKTMPQVSQEVLYGQNKPMGNVGIAQYRTRIAAAVASQNEESAQRQLDMLGAFAASHAGKLKAMEEATKGAQIIKVGDNWEINTGKRLSDSDIKKNGGLTLNSPKLLDYVRAESKALSAAHAQLTKAVATHFGKGAVQSVASPAPTQNISSKKTEEEAARLYDKSVQTPVEPQEKVSKVEANSTELKSSTTPSTSPQSQPASPIAVADAPAQATAAQSASAQQSEIKSAKIVDSSYKNQSAKKPEATKQQAAVSEANPAPVADVATAEQDNPYEDRGILSVMASKIDSAGKNLNQLFKDKAFNPIAQFMKQKANSDAHKSIRPLVREKNFLSAWLNKQVTPVEFHGLDETPEMRKNLAHFATQARKWNVALKDNLTGFSNKPNYQDFKIEDMMQYLIKSDGNKIDIDENVLTAMSYGMYHWMAKEAMSPGKTSEQLNRMHGRDENAEIFSAAYNLLDGVANIEAVVATELGKKAVEALGLSVSKNAPPDTMTRLESALGLHMLVQLEASKLLERRPINTALINSYFEDNDNVITAEKQTMYIFPNKEALAAYKEINKGTKSVVDRMFGAELASTFATDKPVPFKQEFAQHTQQRVPKKLKQVLSALHNTPHTVIPDMWDVMSGIGADRVIEVAGARDLSAVHIENQKGAEAKNKGLMKQLELALEMVGGKLGDSIDMTKQYFIQAEVWKNFRVGITTDSLNQQSSKIHRFMFARPTWTTKVDINNQEQTDRLELAFAAGLGMKTDDQPNVDTLDKYNNEELVSDEVQAALKAMTAGLVRGDWSGADTIRDFATGREGMQTLQTLTMMAKYYNAKTKGDKNVDITLLTGADGKTNGPILTHLALGAAYDSKTLLETLNRGGMYATGDTQPKFYSQWRKDNQGKDLYQDLAANLMRNVDRSSPLFTAMETITGKLTEGEKVLKGGRNLVKTPLTAFAFGSSLTGSIKAMEHKFIESIYKQIEDLNSSGDSTVKLVNALNLMIESQEKGTATIEAKDASELMNLKLKEQQEEDLRAAFRAVMGKPVKETMESYFATFIQRRSDLNSTIQAGFAMYQAAYEAARTKAIEEMVKSGEIASRLQFKDGQEVAGTAIARHDLTPQQENAIREKLTHLLPVAHTAYSVNGNLNEGIYMAKSEPRLSNVDAYKSKVGFKNRVLTADGSMRNQLRTKGMVRVETDPGVAGTPYFIHSLDSNLMHTAIAEYLESLNVHDEIGNGFDTIHQAAGAINKATFQQMIEFSPAREALNMMERISVAVAEGIKDGSMSKATVARMISQWEAIVRRRYKIDKEVTLTAGEVVKQMAKMALENAVDADKVRLTTLSQLGAVDQYTWEGGRYEVTDADRKLASEKLKSIETDIKPEAKLAMSQMVAFVKGTTLPTALKVEAQDAVADQAPAGPIADVVGRSPEAVARGTAAVDGFGLTPWGEIGPSTMVDNNVKAMFEKQPEMNRDQIVKELSKHVTGAYAALLAQAAKVLPANLKVKLVTPDTAPEAVLEKPQQNSRGWYVPTKDGQNEIYVLSADFRYSGLNTETLVHELVHAALAREVHEPSSKASQSLVNDLQALLDHVKQQPGADKFKDATGDVQEFLAWGLSNAEFQKFLTGVKYGASKTVRNRLVTAMKEFTNKLTGLLFGNHTDTKERALNVLIQNAAGLFEAASAPRKNTLSKVLSHAVPANDYSTADIYEALGQSANNPLSAKDDSRLRSLMASMIEVFSPIYGAFGKQAMTNQTMSAASVWANAKVDGTAPFALDAVSAGLAGNEQVAFMLEQVEVTMRAALSGADGQTSIAYRELNKLYEEARTKLDGKLPQSTYDFLFSVDLNADNTSDYLSRFASLGLVHPDINAALSFGTERVSDNAPATSMLGRLQDVFEKVLEWVTGKWTKTYAGQQADSKLESLATQLVMIEAKRRARLNVQQSKTVEAIEDAFRNSAEGVKDKVNEWTNSPFFKESKNGFVKLAGTLTSTYVKDRFNQLVLAYEDFSNQHYHRSQGMIAGLVNEIRGSNVGNITFYKLLRVTKFLEGQRKDMIAGTAKVAVQSFANKGKDLNDFNKKAISNVFMRTDMAALLGPYDLKQLRDMIANPADLAKAITDTTQKLGKPKHMMFYINAAKALGYQMATGEARTANNLMNAHNIARLYGTQHTSEVGPDVIAHTEPLINQLASLYALKYTKDNLKADALKTMDTEMARDDGNGIEMVLKLHQKLQADSKDRLFTDQQALMMKGYTPEIYNPYVEVQVVSKADAADMQELGYGRPMKLDVAAADPEKGGRMLMARHGTGLQRYNTGAMSLTSMNSKGTTKHNGKLDFFSDQGLYNMELMDKINRKNANDVEAMFTAPIEPDTVSDTFMVPVLNPEGKVVNYRYMMQNDTKDGVLDRDNRFDKLLGTMAGSIYDKQTSPKQNRAVIEALAEQYKQEGTKRPMSFIEIGPRSPDPEMRDIYRMLPAATKQAILEVWDSDTMHVRIDLLDITFGYRKLSLADVLKKDRDARTGLDKFMGEFLGFAFTGKLLSQFADPRDSAIRDAKATMRIRAFEEVWQTLVHEAKDILVVKSVSTLMGNVMSNITLLYGYGVPITDMMRHHRIAFRGAVAYKRDSDELFALQAKLDTGTSGNVNEDKKRVVQLKDALAKNPVRELIEAGLMPTIVEDVEIDDDIYSYKSKFIKRMDSLGDKINPDVKAVAKQLYMAHDTKAYKVLSQAAQLSDFLGRYTLYQHMTTKKRNPMSKEDAIQLASDAFINYDVPTHRKMQYLNDMGVVQFTKYYLRIQKVLSHLVKENPGRFMMLMASNAYFDHMASVLDSSMVTRWGNPLANGAFEYAGAIDELATVKMLSAPFGSASPFSQ
jgi:hypothetical protein